MNKKAKIIITFKNNLPQAKIKNATDSQVIQALELLNCYITKQVEEKRKTEALLNRTKKLRKDVKNICKVFANIIRI